MICVVKIIYELKFVYYLIFIKKKEEWKGGIFFCIFKYKNNR